MRRGIRSLVVAVAAALALSLTACAGLPTSSQVNKGLPAGENVEAPDFAFRPDSPQPGATPEQIVDGFLRAGSGPAGGWSVAQEFLAKSFQSKWKPRAGVTIDVGGDRSAVVSDDGSVAVTVSPVANVDATGLYEPSDGGPTRLDFSLTKQAGEWRITAAPDGLVLDQDQFTSVFRRYPLQFFDSTGEFLVPDVRWFVPATVATQLADALIDGGPSPWLQDAVTSAFPEGVVLAQRSVPVVDGVAHVELSTEALSADQGTLNRMQAQLEASLASAAIGRVEMAVGATILSADPVETRSTRIGALPLVQNDAGFGFLAGKDLTAIPGLSDTLATTAATAIQVAADQDQAAVLLSDGTVARADTDSIAMLDSRPALIAPTVDPEGFVWSVPRTSPGALWAFASDGTRYVVGDAWSGSSAVSAFTISRDGARIAAIIGSGSSSEVWIAGIVRDKDGAPQRLTDPLRLGTVAEDGVGLAWVDDTTLSVLSASADEATVTEQPVGGPSTAVVAPTSAVSVAGGTATSGSRLRTSDGQLLIERGSNWQQTASGVRVLATQQGLPQ